MIYAPSLGDVRSLGHSATLGAEAAREVSTDQSIFDSNYGERRSHQATYLFFDGHGYMFTCSLQTGDKIDSGALVDIGY